MKTINWQTLIVTVVVLGAATVVYCLGKPLPAFLTAAVGVVIQSFLPALLSKNAQV